MFSITRFQQLLKGIPCGLVNRLGETCQAQRYDKSFKVHDHLLALIYAQLSDSRSLRELEAGFNAHPQAHYHLGTKALHRSTLADANRRRNPAVFKALVEQLMQQAQRRQRQELKGMLYLLDATPIQLRGHGYGWAEATANPHHQGLKLHLLLDAKASLPVDLDVTAANVNDICSARRLEPQAGATYVFDKGYTDYAWWHRLHEAKACFVTRFKIHAGVDLVRTLPLTERESQDIVSDDIVTFRYRSNRAGHRNPYFGKELRRIVVRGTDSQKALTLATNDLHSSAMEIAALYRQRWGVELFFKWLKQHLKIRRFLGRSPNAVLLQLYAAITTYLLVWLYQRTHQLKGSLHLIMVGLKNSLFSLIETEQQHRYRQQRSSIATWVREHQRVMAF